MILPFILIVIICIVWYLQLKNSKSVKIADISLLVLGTMALIIVAYQYMRLTNNSTVEKFTNHNNNNYKKKHSLDNRDIGSAYDNSLIKVMNSELKKQTLLEQEENDVNDTNPLKQNYEKFKRMSPFQDIRNQNINKDHVNKIDNLLKSGLKLSENFDPTTNEDIKSVFAPQIIMGSDTPSLNSNMEISSGSESLNWDSTFSHSGDGMTFNNTMKPVSNLWKDDHAMFDQQSTNYQNSWTKSMSAYNTGSGNPNQYLKPSDWATNPQGSPTAEGNTRSNFTNIPTTTKANTKSSDQKLCGAYDDLNLATDQSGNILIGNYTLAKKYFPGYTYIPPVYWDVPQRHTPVCAPPDLNVRKLTGLMDRGTPINALELNQDGSISNTEDTVSLTNVGSLMPKFNYFETPFSQPYA
jgi:hypothetical protein